MVQKQFMRKLEEFSQRQKTYRNYIETTSIEQFLSDLAETGFCLTEEELLKKYEEIGRYAHATDYFYNVYQLEWDRIDDKRNLPFNSDSFMPFYKKLLKSKYDISTLPDIDFIEDSMFYVEADCPKEQVQNEVMSILKRVILSSEKYNIRTLNGLFDDHDFNEFMRFYIKKCHNRDRNFNELMKQYYESFDDADKKIYRIK